MLGENNSKTSFQKTNKGTFFVLTEVYQNGHQKES